jgi:hypothetical protein
MQLKYENSMKIIKYQSIPQYIQTMIVFSEKTVLFENLLKIYNIDDIDENNNVFFLEWFDFDTLSFQISIFYYFDWFPHIQHFVIFNDDFDFVNVIQYLIKKEKESNSRKWNIFDDGKKRNITFLSFIHELISNYPALQKMVLMKNQRFEYDCKICNHYKNNQFIKDYMFCEKLNLDDQQHQCHNFQFME